MEDIYDYYYDMWFSEGGSLFAVFSHMGSAEGRWGAWGTLEHYGQPLSETPKRRALITASERYRGEAAGEQGEQNEQPEQQQGSEQSGNNEQEQAGENQPNEAEAKDGRNTYIFGHSLILHENSTESNELTQVPNWLHLLSDSADKDFSVSGQYGFLPQHTNFAPSIEDTPLEGYSPFPQWGFELADAAWSDETGENFADVNFDSILLTAAYFIQYQSANTPYDGDNPTQTTPLAETQKIIDWVRRAEPGIDIYIYENWPDLPLAVNPATFPMTAQQLAEYHQATMNDDVGGFHRWWLDYHDDLVAANPAVNVKMIPVGPTMAKVLSHERFSTLTTNDLFEDDALHGRASVYFIASLVTYMGMYGEQPPEDFVIPEAVHPLIRQHYTDIVETIWHELSVFNFDNGQSRIW